MRLAFASAFAKALFAKINAHPRWCALALGVIAATGFEPLHLWPLTLLAMAGLIALLARAQTWRRAALIGWLFGVGHFILGNNWIATAFTYQAEMPAWIGWVAVVGLAFYLAIYPALAALGAWLIATRQWFSPSSSGEGLGVGAVRITQPLTTDPTPTPPLKRRGFSPNEKALVLAFAACWIVTEWLRSWVFTGYVWNPLGVVLVGPWGATGLAWIARWTGTYGLSGIAICAAGFFGNWLRAGLIETGRARALALISLAFWGMFTVQQMCWPLFTNTEKGTIPFTLVQPDIPQGDLDNPALFETHFIKTARLTLPKVRGEKRLVLWPESGIPDYLRAGYPAYFYQSATYAADPKLARGRIGAVIGPGAMLLTGTVDLEMRGQDVAGARNVVTAIDDSGAIRGSYAKAHLVPGGEYLPLRPLLEPLGATRLVAGSLDFWPGPGPRTIDLGHFGDLGGFGRAGVQICYEIIFSGQVVDRAHRPDYIFNPSNDGWFGSFGPPQHLAQARLRAIEEGLPVLRATTTGISAVIDADGIVRQFIPRHTAARIDGLIPPAHPPTLFAQVGNMLPLGWALVLFACSLVAMRRRQG